MILSHLWVAVLSLVTVVMLNAPVGAQGQSSDADRQVWDAADRGDVTALVAALAAGGLPDLYRDEMGRTALHAVSFGGHYGHVQALDHLLEANANLNHIDKHDGTPLMIASSLGYASAVAKLLAAGARVDLQDSEGYTALSWAIRNNQSEVVDLLLDRRIEGANETLNMRDRWGNTGLVLATLYGYQEIVSKLTAMGANTNLRDEMGYSGNELLREYGMQEERETSSSTTTAAATTTSTTTTAAATTTTTAAATYTTTPHKHTHTPPPTNWSDTSNSSAVLRETFAAFTDSLVSSRR